MNRFKAPRRLQVASLEILDINFFDSESVSCMHVLTTPNYHLEPGSILRTSNSRTNFQNLGESESIAPNTTGCRPSTTAFNCQSDNLSKIRDRC